MEDSKLEYKLYIEDLIALEGEQLDECLESRLAECWAFVNALVRDYIWQNEPFGLTCAGKKGDTPAHLLGQTDYGDNVDDEWFIVYLLAQLTLEYPDISASVCDSDGEFLLIEAAHCLPKWLKPEASENRIFIKEGNVHIIPLPSSPREITIFPTGTPTLPIALNLVFGPHTTEAAPGVQQSIDKRIGGYPDKALQTLHHAHVFIPPPIKYVLDSNPPLISAAVQAFNNRDPVAIKACRDMKYFPPSERVMTRVRFTRCLYAQLIQQEFQPDRRSQWQLPSPSNPHYKGHDLGFKITCGFEILCSKSSASYTKDKHEANGPKWDRFLSSLHKHGFFKGEMEGSKMYQQLMADAQAHFQNSINHNASSSADVGSTVLRMLEDVNIDVAKMKEDGKNIPQEDDDSWLDICPEDLEAMMESYQTVNSDNNPTSDTKKQSKPKATSRVEEFDLESVTRSMNAFVENVSSFEGAEFPGENDVDTDVQFDASSFMDTMKRLLERGEGLSNLDESNEKALGSDDDVDDDSDEYDDDDDANEEEGEMLDYMHDMDKELAATRIGDSFEKEQPPMSTTGQRSTSEGACAQPSDVDDEDNDKDVPVNVDLNLVKNLLESFTSQQGLAGPASNILNSMGIRLPANMDGT